MEIRNFNSDCKNEYNELLELFKMYCDELYINDPSAKMNDDMKIEFFEWILKDCDYDDGWILIAIDTETDEITGFVFAHIDRQEKGWCAKEGWGCIREVYVSPIFRKKGIGEKLIKVCEEKMKAFEPKGYYLTSDGNDSFWGKLGYCFEGEIESLNNTRVFAKR